MGAPLLCSRLTESGPASEAAQADSIERLAAFPHQQGSASVGARRGAGGVGLMERQQHKFSLALPSRSEEVSRREICRRLDCNPANKIEPMAALH